MNCEMATKLSLDPAGVLSAWEQMGGSAFSSDDAFLFEDPAAVTLDLSSWEARLKPLAASSASNIEASLFNLFNPVELGLSFLPCSVPSMSAPSTVPSPCAADSAQVVPACPSMSGTGFDDFESMEDNCVDGDFAAAFGDSEDGDMSLHFSDCEAMPPSPFSGSDFGVVPDIGSCGSTNSSHPTHSANVSQTSSPVVTKQESQGQEEPIGPIASTHMAASLPALPMRTASFNLPSFVPICHEVEIKPESEACEVKQEFPSAEPFVPPQPQARAPPIKASSRALLTPAQPQLPSVPQLQQQQAAVQTAVQTHMPSATMSQPQLQHYNTQQQNGQYVRTRAECLERYREKKARRLYTKKIRYQLRKINADKRPRIKGRFVKKEELAEFLAAQRAGQVMDDGEDCGFGWAVDAMDSDYE